MSTICGPTSSRRSSTRRPSIHRWRASTPTTRRPPALPSRTAPSPELPARLVPVPAQVGGVEGDDDQMAGADGDLLVAPRADVGLQRLERMDQPDLEVALRLHANSAHASSRTITAMATPTST